MCPRLCVPLTTHPQEDVGVEDDEWALPEGVQPLLEELPVYSENTASGIALLWAPKPFNQRSGHMRRAFDVPLVNAWFMVGRWRWRGEEGCWLEVAGL